MINTSALQPLGDKWPDDATGADRIRQFAGDNGFSYKEALGANYSHLGLAPGQRPAWVKSFSDFASEQVHGVSGTVAGYECTMFVDKVVTSVSGNDPARQTPHFTKSGVICVKLHKTFPQLVLDSNKNDKYLLKIRSAQIDPAQKLDLEGNFSKYFDFYAPRGINVNSLTVLAPNFMQILIDSSATFDAEIYGDRLYLLTQAPLFTSQVMAEALQALEAQLEYMHRLEASWSYAPLKPPFDTLLFTGRLGSVVISSPYAVKIGPWRVSLLWLVLGAFGVVMVGFVVAGIVW